MNRDALPPLPLETDGSVDPRYYWSIIVRRKWLVALCVALSVTAGVFYAWRTPRQYATSSTVIVEKPTGVMTMLEYSLWQGQINPNTQIALIRTRTVAQRASDLLRKGPGRRISPLTLMRSTHVEAIPNTEMIEITARWSNPVVARQIANALALAFVEHKQEIARQGQQTTLQFIRAELKKARSVLDRSEDRLRAFREENPEVSLTDPGAENRLDPVANAVSQLNQARVALVDAGTRLAERRRQWQAQNSTLARLDIDAIRDNEAVQKTRERLIEKEAELQQAQASLTPRGVETLHPGLAVEVRRLRARLQRQITGMVQGGADLKLHQSLAAELAGLQTEELAARARAAALEGVVRSLRASRQALPARQQQLAQLLRERDQNEKIFNTLKQREKETEISRVSQLGNARVADAAETNPVPIWPKPRQTVLFAVLLGLSLGVAGAFLLEYLDDSLESPEEVERWLHLPTLGAVPMIRHAGQRLLNSVSSRSGLVEGYRMIRSSISFTAVDAPVHTLLVSSAEPGEGKSTVAANLAIIHAQKGMQVILVDCDLRRPAQQKLFNLAGSVGFTNLILGTASLEEAAQEVGIDNLRVIPSGPLPPNPTEMLDSARARQLMQELKQQADLVLFDAPPATVLSDPIVLSTLVDGVLVVVEAGQTNRNVIARAVYHLIAAKARLLGVVLNKVNPRRDGYYSYYYYQYYYSGYADGLTGDDSEPGRAARALIGRDASAAPAAGRNRGGTAGSSSPGSFPELPDGRSHRDE